MRHSIRGIWRRYWIAYGGLPALLRSSYFRASIALTLLTFQYWTTPLWWETPLSILPSLLGFTLGGLAVLIGISEARVLKLLSHQDEGKPDTDLAIIVASFVHFVLVQGIALLLVFLCKALYVPWDTVPLLPGVIEYFGIRIEELPAIARWAMWGCSYLAFMYALLLVLPTTLEVFRISKVLELAAQLDDSDTPNTLLPTVSSAASKKTSA